VATAADATWADDLSHAALALARRFAADATLWCIAPAWPEHARHVAVEFVHPVIVGTRALPAVAVDGPDPVGALRAMVRRGDVLVAVGPSSDAVIREVLRRADAWGIETVWIGTGDDPPAGAADHVLWVHDADAVHDGGLVLRYHLLWELTHVCFEHPGLLRPVDTVCTDEVCITCSDEGRVGEVVTVGAAHDATVRVAGGLEPVDVTLVAPVHPGELVLVHAGTAIALLEEDHG
jgi:hypothetical protein